MDRTESCGLIVKDPTGELPPLLVICKGRLTGQHRKSLLETYNGFRDSRAAVIDGYVEVYQCIGGRWTPLKSEPESIDTFTEPS